MERSLGRSPTNFRGEHRPYRLSSPGQSPASARSGQEWPHFTVSPAATSSADAPPVSASPPLTQAAPPVTDPGSAIGPGTGASGRFPQPRPQPAEESAILAEVIKREKPVDIRFDVATKTAMGKVYQAKLEVLRTGQGGESRVSSEPVIFAQVQILDKIGASVTSTFLTVTPMQKSEWQDISRGGRGYWTWRIEPQRPARPSCWSKLSRMERSMGKSASGPLSNSRR